MRCSICGQDIDLIGGSWTEGHNAEPVNDGRCCTSCNNGVVIPRRLMDQIGQENPKPQDAT